MNTPLRVVSKSNGFTEILDTNNRVIAFWPASIHRPERIPETLRVAEFICTACNAHESLAEACRLLHFDLGRISPQVFDEEISEKAKSALANAIELTSTATGKCTQS